MSKKQTPVEWLSERLIRMIPTNHPIYEQDIKLYVQQALQMEKKQETINASFNKLLQALIVGFDMSNKIKFPTESELNEFKELAREAIKDATK